MKFIITNKSCEFVVDLQKSGRSEVHEERKVNKSFKETWASPSTKDPRAGPRSLTPRKASPFTKRTIPTSEKKWKVIHAHSPDGDTWQRQFPKWSQ